VGSLQQNIILVVLEMPLLPSSLLSVRSFLGRLRRSQGEHMVEIGWEPQQGKDLPLQGCEWGKMPQGGLGGVQHGQGDLLEGAQQAFGSGPCGGAGGSPRDARAAAEV